MFQIDSLTSLSEDSQLKQFEENVRIVKLDNTKGHKIRESILKIGSTKFIKSQKSVKMIDCRIRDKKIEEGSTSLTSLSNRKSIRIQRSQSPNLNRRCSKLDEIVKTDRLSSAKQLGKPPSILINKGDESPTLGNINHLSAKEKSNMMNQLQKKETQKKQLQLLNSTSANVNWNKPQSMNNLLSKPYFTIREFRKLRTENLDQLDKLNAYSIRNEYLHAELVEVADKLMQNQTEADKIQHQPLFRYLCEYQKNKQIINKNGGIIDETEQIILLIRMLKYIANQDTIYKKALIVIIKEITPYLLPKHQSDQQKFEKATHELYRLSDNDKPYINYQNYKQISDVLLKGISHFQKENYMAFSDMIQQKQTYNHLSELHKKQIEAEWTEKDKVSQKEQQINAIIEGRVSEIELKLRLKFEKAQEAQDGINKRIQEECKQQIDSYVRQNLVLVESSNKIKAHSASLQNQINDIKDKIRMGRHHILFQQIAQQHPNTYQTETGIQCNLQLEISMIQSFRNKFQSQNKSLSPFNSLLKQHKQYYPIQHKYQQS